MLRLSALLSLLLALTCGTAVLAADEKDPPLFSYVTSVRTLTLWLLLFAALVATLLVAVWILHVSCTGAAAATSCTVAALRHRIFQPFMQLLDHSPKDANVPLGGVGADGLWRMQYPGRPVVTSDGRGRMQ